MNRGQKPTIKEEFRDKAIIHGRIFLFRPSDALAVIERCHQLGKTVYGIDAFKLRDENKIQPFMDNSIDYSSIWYDRVDATEYENKYHVKKDCDLGHWRESTQFITDRLHSDFVFEIVCQE